MSKRSRMRISYSRDEDRPTNTLGVVEEIHDRLVFDLQVRRQPGTWKWTNDKRGIVWRTPFFSFIYYRDASWERMTR